VAAVVISPSRYEQLLEALEEQEDEQAFDQALAEEGDNIPWEQVKADLGWQ
jgi:PHD/YefM family antitoxin component YafN of YafNO toxin-antitoxin module